MITLMMIKKTCGNRRQQKKKEKRGNLNVAEKEQFRKYEEKGKKAMCNLSNKKKNI